MCSVRYFAQPQLTHSQISQLQVSPSQSAHLQVSHPQDFLAATFRAAQQEPTLAGVASAT